MPKDSNPSEPDAQDAGYIDSRASGEYRLIALAALLVSISASHASLMAIAFQRVGYDLPTIGILLSALAITAVIFTLASGAVMNIIGALGAVRLSMILVACGVSSLIWTRGDFAPAIVSRLVWGAGVGLFLPCSMVYVQSRLNQNRFVYLVTVFSAMVPLAQAIAPTMGELMLDYFGLTAMFIEGAAPAVIAFLLTFGLRPLQRSTRSKRLDFQSSLQRRFILPVIGLLAGGTIFGYAIAYIGPALAERGISLSWYFIASTCAMIFGRVGASRVLTRLPAPLIAGAGLILSCLSLTLAAFAFHPLVAALAGVALGAGNSVMYPVVSSWMSRGLAATERGGVQAISATAFYFGIYATPYPQSWLIGAWGYATTQLGLAAVGALVGVAMIMMGRRA